MVISSILLIPLSRYVGVTLGMGEYAKRREKAEQALNDPTGSFLGIKVGLSISEGNDSVRLIEAQPGNLVNRSNFRQVVGNSFVLIFMFFRHVYLAKVGIYDTVKTHPVHHSHADPIEREAETQSLRESERNS